MGSKIKDRSQFALDTADSYFDQVVAMSQGVVNQSFERLLQDIPGVAQISASDDREGFLEAELKAPRILFKGNTANATDVYYQLRVNTGSAQLSNDHTINLAGWTFTLAAPLNEVTLSISSQDSPSQKKEKQKVLEHLSTKYQGFVPGQYSVQRLFCAISSAKWNDPETLLSEAVVDGNSMTLQEYMDLSPQHRINVDKLGNLLRYWARNESTQEISTLGIKFELDKSVKLKIDEPSFKPVHIFTQVYPYLDSDHPYGIMDAGKDGKKSKGDYNCLAYCENVDLSWNPALPSEGPKEVMARPLPSQPKLPHSGNLASPAVGGSPEILGSFALDYRVFLERFLLPQLQELCMAVQFHVGKPERYVKDGSQYISPTYSIGQQLEVTGKVLQASDTQFAFTRAADGSSYQWNQPRSAESSLGAAYCYRLESSLDKVLNFFVNMLKYGDHDIYADSNVTVSWSAGTQEIKISGRTFYYYDIRFADDSKMEAAVCQRKYTVVATWSFSIFISDPTGGVMEPEVRGIAKGEPGKFIPELWKVEIPNYPNIQNGVTGNTLEAIEKELKNTVSQAIGMVISNIKRRFKDCGKLIYPGHGELKYSKPVLTSNGSILAYAEYAKPSASDGSVSFPPIEKRTLSASTKREPKTNTFLPSFIDEGLPKLHWTTSMDYDKEEKLGRLKFTATNELNETLSFNFIKINLLPAPDKDAANHSICLFNGAKWDPEPKSLLETLHDWITSLRSLLGGKSKAATKDKQESDDTIEQPTPDQKAPPSKEAVSQDMPKDKIVAENPAKQSEDDTEEQYSKNKFLYHFEGDWKPSDAIVSFAGINTDTNNIEFVIRKRGGVFEMPKGARFSLVLQGPVEAIGLYPIKISEAWSLAKDKAKAVGGSAPSFRAVDYKMAQIDEDGKAVAWDVSDKLAEQAKEAKEARP